MVGNLDTQFPFVGPNPPISLREREQRRREKRHCGSRQCSKKRSVQYQIEVAARQWLPFTGSFTNGLHTALSNASFFSSSPPLFCSLSFSHVRLSSPHHRGRGDNEILQAVLGPVGKKISLVLVSTDTLFLTIFSTFQKTHPQILF